MTMSYLYYYYYYYWTDAGAVCIFHYIRLLSAAGMNWFIYKLILIRKKKKL